MMVACLFQLASESLFLFSSFPYLIVKKLKNLALLQVISFWRIFAALRLIRIGCDNPMIRFWMLTSLFFLIIYFLYFAWYIFLISTCLALIFVHFVFLFYFIFFLGLRCWKYLLILCNLWIRRILCYFLFLLLNLLISIEILKIVFNSVHRRFTVYWSDRIFINKTFGTLIVNNFWFIITFCMIAGNSSYIIFSFFIEIT